MATDIDLVKKKLIEVEKKLNRKEIEMLSIQHIGKALSSELRIEQLLLLIMNEVTRLMNAERSTFYIVDEERGELWSKIAQKAEILEIRLKIGTGIAGHVAKTGEIINIGGGAQVTINETLRILEEITKKKAKVKYIEKQKGDMLHTSADISKAKRLLNYQPKVGLREGLAKEVAWFKG